MAVTLATIAPIGFDDFADPAWMDAMASLGCISCQAYRNDSAHLTNQQLADWLASRHMPCDSLHGAFGPGLDPSSCDETTRQLAVETYRKEAELVKFLGGDLVVIHCSAPRDDQAHPGDDHKRLDSLTQSMAELSQIGSDMGVRMAWENLPPNFPTGSDAADLAQLLRKLNLPASGMCFDTGHAHIAGDVAQALSRCSDQIIYIHASDNHGQTDQHMLPFCGSIDWQGLARIIAASPIDCPVMIEIFYDLAGLQMHAQGDLPIRLADWLARAQAK